MISTAPHASQTWLHHLPRTPLRAPRPAVWLAVWLAAWLWPSPPQDSVRLESPDVMDQMLLCDEDDRNLLRLVLCAAVATLILALACSLAG
jgi:hypothetical protein